MENKIKRTSIFLIIFLFLNLGSVLSEENITDYEKAGSCLKNSKEIMNDLSKQGFNIERVNDTLVNAEDIYDAQVVLKDSKKKYDFSDVILYCNEIEKINENAAKSIDEFDALKKFYEMSFDSSDEINTSSVDKIMSEIDFEIKSERYEKTESLIKKAYEEISVVKSEQTALKLFYKTTTRSVKDFFKENWKFMAISLILVLFFALFYKTIIYKWHLKRKLEKLELRKSTIKGLIASVQKDYFEKGIVSEGMYNVKIKKYAELIRDIDREIPLIKEELLRINKRLRITEKQKEEKK